MSYHTTPNPELFVFIDDALDMRTVAIMHHCDYGPSFICFNTVESAESYIDITSEVTKDMLIALATSRKGLPRELFPRVRCLTTAAMQQRALDGDIDALNALPRYALPPICTALPNLF